MRRGDGPRRDESVSGAPGDDFVGRPTGGFARAVSWSFVLTGARAGVTLVVSLVLARLLGPEIFGIVAMALVFVFFLEMFVQQGLIPAIVQRPNLTRSHLDTAFWMTAVTATAFLPLVIVASGWWAGVNETPQLGPVLMALSGLLPLKGLSMVQEAQIRRQMDFRVLAVRTTAAVVTGGLVGISAAAYGFGVWALVVQQLVAAGIELVLIWRMSPWRPRRHFSRRSLRELFAFSGPSSLASVGVFLHLRADALLIGLFFGPVVVGLYRMATRLIDMVLDVAGGALHSTFLPELSRYQDDPEGFNERTLEVLRMGAIMAIPLLGVLVAVAEPLLGLLGEDWAHAVLGLQIMCLLAVTQTLAAYTGPILQAIGRPGIFAGTVWITAPLSAGSFFVAALFARSFDVEFQVTAIAAVRTLLVGAGFFAVVLPALRAGTGLRVRQVLGVLGPSVLAAATGGGLVIAARNLGPLPWPTAPLIDLCASGALGMVIMGAVLHWIEPGMGRLTRAARQVLGR